MSELNALPQALLGFLIVCSVAVACSAVVMAWSLKTAVKILLKWYLDWYDSVYEPEPEPRREPVVDPLQAKRDRMAHARAAKKKHPGEIG